MTEFVVYAVVVSFLLAKWKYVAMVILSPVVRLFQMRQMRCDKQPTEPLGHSVSDNKSGGVERLCPTWLTKLKRWVWHYLYSYVRYVGIRVGSIPSMRIRLFIY